MSNPFASQRWIDVCLTKSVARFRVATLDRWNTVVRTLARPSTVSGFVGTVGVGFGLGVVEGEKVVIANDFVGRAARVGLLSLGIANAPGSSQVGPFALKSRVNVFSAPTATVFFGAADHLGTNNVQLGKGGNVNVHSKPASGPVGGHPSFASQLAAAAVARIVCLNACFIGLAALLVRCTAVLVHSRHFHCQQEEEETAHHHCRRCPLQPRLFNNSTRERM